MQNEKEHITISPTRSEELYRFGADGNLRMYSYDRLFYSLYGYDGGTTRTYKYSMDLSPNWVNDRLESVNFNLHTAMFYPNSYLNFNQDGYYTKHYYNGMERIASRLGEQSLLISTHDPELQDRKEWQDSLIRKQITEITGYEFLPVGEEQDPDDPKPVFELPQVGMTGLQPIGGGSVYYYHPNHLGSTAYVTDQNQTIVQGFLYAPFGEITNEYNAGWQSGTLPKYSFNAKELDEETGMYYYEARYYAPPVFTSRDAMMDQKPWLSPYHYCSNNPVGRIDPTGMMDDWYLKADGTPTYDKNVNENTKLGKDESYIGKTANWFGMTENDMQYLYHGDENGKTTRRDMTCTVFGIRKTEIYTIPIDALFGFADGVTENNENITITEKGNIHYRNKNTGRIYHGNQYESAKYLKNTSVGKSLNTISHLGFAMNAAELGLGIYNDGGKIGENTSGAIGSITGGWLGFKAGALIGGSIGGCFGGFGAVPGAIIGGVIGSVGGSWGGEKAGKKIYNNLK